MTHTYTWRCTACPRPRVTVETTEDTPPVCPTCGKVMKTHDCCGVSAEEILEDAETSRRYRELDTKPGGMVSFVAGQHDPKRCGCGDCTRQKSNPEPMPEGEYEVEQFTTEVKYYLPPHARKIGIPFEQTLDAAFGRSGVYPAEHTPNYSNPFESPEPLTGPLDTFLEKYPDADPVFLTTNLERRLDVTERLVRELTERLYPVVQSDVETEVLSDCSPLGERVERINGSLGRLLGGLDLP